jgi:hypothetical protein
MKWTYGVIGTGMMSILTALHTEEKKTVVAVSQLAPTP